MTVEVITIPIDQLRELLRSVVREELGLQTPEWMTREQLSKDYGWSMATINRKMKKGLPFSGGNGEHPRFSRKAIDQWLTEQNSYL